ncbi:hypothetical protein T06_6754 [Trichinella sp. T6]|uniref:Uncharacterized protein n=1 Tax=Trichinella murrelli TaxID=144512 RepID=A0A0V0TCG6_9BILA|nr:hypothetical protein T05_998 [Trichinella murrelli]KRX69659.1 hypothetical protein T06_8089 [Trichinella sp. T6]KRX74000.1 hypothetical protein T06_6754 [Trichinella sp. T6]
MDLFNSAGIRFPQRRNELITLIYTNTQLVRSGSLDKLRSISSQRTIGRTRQVNTRVKVNPLLL